MSIVFLFLTCMSGICALGFLLAAVISFQQVGVPGPHASVLARLVYVLFGCWGSVIRGIALGWKRNQELRRLVYLGGGCLVAAFAFAWIAFSL